MDYAISGIAVLPLILGLVEFGKKLGVKGNGSTVLALVLGVFFASLYMAMQQGLIPEVALPWISVGVFGLAGGLAAAGLYDLGKRLFASD